MGDESDAVFGRATARMVAERARVSRVAVSRAFNPSASLHPEKRERILRIAAELNYTPDRAARALVLGRSHLVGIIVPDACSSWERQEIDALTSGLQAEGFAPLLFKTNPARQMDPALLTYMRGFNLDSAIVFVENVRPANLKRALGRTVPIYVHYPAGDAGAVPADANPPCDRLNVLTRPGVEQAVALLAGYGARRIAYLSGNARTEADAVRRAILREVVAAQGLSPPVTIPGDFTYETAFHATVDAFRIGTGCDAIFAANDVGAFGAMDALRHDLGLSVPGDVSVIGFDDIAQSAWRSYNLTTVRLDLTDRVRALLRLILRRLAVPDATPLEESIATCLVMRCTVG